MQEDITNPMQMINRLDAVASKYTKPANVMIIPNVPPMRKSKLMYLNIVVLAVYGSLTFVCE
jgi:hypothetical protein